ncbi:MAG: hypothetical protein ACRD8U_05785 [Pyrinomonadaceae bacterium]
MELLGRFGKVALWSDGFSLGCCRLERVAGNESSHHGAGAATSEQFKKSPPAYACLTSDSPQGFVALLLNVSFCDIWISSLTYLSLTMHPRSTEPQ